MQVTYQTLSGIQFMNSKFDGIFGMAYDSISAGNVTTPFSNLIKNGQCDEPVFAFWLNRDTSNGSKGGELTICGIDKNYYEGEIHYTPVTRQGYWQIKVDSITIGSDSIDEQFQVAVDTGTSYIYGPSTEIESLSRIVGAKKSIFKVCILFLVQEYPICQISRSKSAEKILFLRQSNMC